MVWCRVFQRLMIGLTRGRKVVALSREAALRLALAVRLAPRRTCLGKGRFAGRRRFSAQTG